MKPQKLQDKSDRPGTENFLKQSQERCWLAVQGSREGLWDWDILTNQVYFASRFKEILGYATAEMPNELEAWEAKLHPDDRGRVLAALHNHLESRIPFDIEYRLRRKTGDYCWVHARGQGIWNEAGRATRMAGSISDITERKRSEVAFHERHLLLQAINSVQTQFVADAGPQVVFDNMLTHLLELTRSEYGFIGEIQFTADGAPSMKKSYLKMRGRPYLKTHAISNIAWNEETRAFYAENALKGMDHNLETLFGAAIVTGKPVVANSPHTDSRRGGLPDGHPPLKAFLGVPFYSNTQMTGMVGVANREEGYDTTIIDYLQPFLTTCSRIVEAYRISCHKQQVEEKVREQAALLNVATDAIMVRGVNHRILYWNRGAERLYGWSSEEVLGQDANELLYAEPLSNLPEMQRELEATGEWQGELNQMTKAGQPIVVNSRWTLVRQEGKLPSILVVNTDITEKKQLEAQFLRTQRLESLGTLAGGIAHDFNNILTPILGFAQLLPKKLSLDPQAQDIFKIIETNAVRGKDLIQQILTFARGLEGKRGAVQLRHLMTEIKKIATQTFPKNIEIQTSVSKELPTVEGDATQLHQVLMNLAVNARDAMPQGGILRLSAKPFTVDTHYARLHLEAQEGSYTLIEVKDTGVGIPAERLERIFEPFFTTKAVGHGTGLGLSTAIGIVRSHGGFMEVYSEVNRGTQFNIFLPTFKSAESIAEECSELPQGKGETILVVDDEAPIRTMTQAVLTAHGYQVLTANNGLEAIALLTQHREPIEIILVDLNMPTLGGDETIPILQRINPEVKIVVMSGLPGEREGFAESKVVTTLAKPYTTEQLLKKVADVVRSPSDFPQL